MVLMAIRCHDEVTLATVRGLMRVTRAAMRGVDRIGCVDDSTLLLCMPSIDEAMAVKRARQITRAADSTGLGWKGIGPRPVSIGVVQAAANDSFRSLVSRVVELADEARESFSDPICVGAGALSASQ
jgi:hypothetical protein